MSWRNRIIGYDTKPASEFTANPLNWRTHPGVQRETLRGLLGEVGWVGAVLENKQTGNLIDGHARIEEALNSNESQPIPYLLVDLTPEEEKLVLASFDPISALATADKERLEQLLKDVATPNEAVDSMLANLAKEHGVFLDNEPKDAEPQIDTAEELRQKWSTETGQLWVIGNHRLLVGDSYTRPVISRLMGAELARMAVTSPPYNQNIDKFKPSGMQKESTAFVNRMADAYGDSKPEDQYRDEQVTMLTMIAEFLTPDGSIFYNHKIRYREKEAVSPMEWLSRLPFPVRQEIIWDRGSSITLNARMLIPADERIYWLRVGDEFVFNDIPEIKAWSTVWRIAAKNDVQISAPFATEIPTRCIQIASMKGDIILEPHSGSGTTMVAAENEGRRCYASDINAGYVAVCLERMATAFPSLKIEKVDQARAA